jgi:hypothetical protein
MNKKILLTIVFLFTLILASVLVLSYFYFSKTKDTTDFSGKIFRTLGGRETVLGIDFNKSDDQISHMRLTGILKDHYKDGENNYFVIVVPYKGGSLDVAANLGSDSNQVTDITQEVSKDPSGLVEGGDVTTEYRDITTKEIVGKYGDKKGGVFQVDVWLSQGDVDEQKCGQSSWCTYIHDQIEKYKDVAGDLRILKIPSRSVLSIFKPGEADVVVGPVVSVRASY